jgi:hypothetical protein
MENSPPPAHDANGVRGVVVDFPPERVIYARPANHEIQITYRGEARTFSDPLALREHFWPQAPAAQPIPAPIVAGDQLAVIHNGVTRIYAPPEAFADLIAAERQAQRRQRRVAAFMARPWWARLQFICADAADYIVLTLAALAMGLQAGAQ